MTYQKFTVYILYKKHFDEILYHCKASFSSHVLNAILNWFMISNDSTCLEEYRPFLLPEILKRLSVLLEYAT